MGGWVYVPEVQGAHAGGDGGTHLHTPLHARGGRGQVPQDDARRRLYRSTSSGSGGHPHCLVTGDEVPVVMT